MVQKAIVSGVIAGTCVILGVSWAIDRAISRAVSGAWKPC